MWLASRQTRADVSRMIRDRAITAYCDGSSETRSAKRARAADCSDRFGRRFPSAVACQDDDLASLFSYLRFPVEHHKRLRHSNSSRAPSARPNGGSRSSVGSPANAPASAWSGGPRPGQPRLAWCHHDSGTRITEIVGVSAVNAARILGEGGDIRRFASPAAFAAGNGTSPLPASSGRTDRHRLNRGGNRRLYRALYVSAITQTRHDPRAAAYLAKRRAGKKTVARRCGV